MDAAILAQDLAFEGKTFGAGEGLVSDDVESTISNIGILGRDGMRGTDEVILRLMTKGRA